MDFPTRLAALATVLAILLGLTGCSKGAVPIGAPGASGGAEYIYIKPEVSVSHLPKLYEPFTVRGKATAIKEDLEDAELWLRVSGAVYLDGEDRWHGPLKLGESKTISATFAFVTEGNHAVAAGIRAGPGLFQPSPFSVPIGMYVSRSESKLGIQTGQSGGVISWGPGDPHLVPAGHIAVLDTTLPLNPSPSPRIEFIDSQEDLARLQAEGLLPGEFRYEWKLLESKGYFDFSKQFLVAYFDALRPTPGHLLLFEGNVLLWDNGTLKGNLKTYAVPPEVNRASQPVSSVAVYALSRLDKPIGLDVRAFQGIRTFELTIDDSDPIHRTVDLQVLEPANVP